VYTEDQFLPVSALQHVIFCERRAALVCLERQWLDNVSTMEGNVLHEIAHKAETENRNMVKIARSLWIRSHQLGIYGRADIVEFEMLTDQDTRPGVALTVETGFWRPFPVEYKRGRLREEMSFDTQLCAQGLCLEEMLGIHVHSGAIYFGQPHRRLIVLFNESLREQTRNAAFRLHEIVDSGVTPKARPEAKCRFCALNDLCLPNIQKYHKNITDYIRRLSTQPEETDETTT